MHEAEEIIDVVFPTAFCPTERRGGNWVGFCSA